MCKFPVHFLDINDKTILRFFYEYQGLITEYDYLFDIFTNQVSKIKLRPEDFLKTELYMKIAYSKEWRDKFNKGDRK